MFLFLVCLCQIITLNIRLRNKEKSKSCSFVLKSCTFVNITVDRGYPLALVIDI